MASPTILLEQNCALSNLILTPQALEYIHKSVLQYHGNLSSNSLGVDSHWVLKISDYGLRDFRAGCSDTEETEDHKYTSELDLSC